MAKCKKCGKEYNPHSRDEDEKFNALYIEENDGICIGCDK